MSQLVALITGGSSGMGLALTKHLLSQNDERWRIGIADLQPPPQDIISNPRILFHNVDITDYDQQAAFFRDVFEWGEGHIDYFAANAGIIDSQNIAQKPKDMKLRSDGLPEPLSEKVLDVDLNAVVQGVWLFRFFNSKRSDGKTGGKIVITASTSGLYLMPTHPLYCAAKHGVVGLTKSLPWTLKKEGITINAICPNLVDTPLMSKEMRELWPKEHLTPMSTVIKAHDRFLNGDETGQICELSQDQMYMRGLLDFPSESQRWTIEKSGPVMRRMLLMQHEQQARSKL